MKLLKLKISKGLEKLRIFPSKMLFGIVVVGLVLISGCTVGKAPGDWDDNPLDHADLFDGETEEQYAERMANEAPLQEAKDNLERLADIYRQNGFNEVADILDSQVGALEQAITVLRDNYIKKYTGMEPIK